MIAEHTSPKSSSRCARVELLLVAELRDRNALHQFHDEERPAHVRRARIEDLGDVRMIHHRQRLPLLLEARDDLARVHAQLDDLQRHPPRHRLHLLRHPDRAEAALANSFEEPVSPNHRPAQLGCRMVPLRPQVW